MLPPGPVRNTADLFVILTGHCNGMSEGVAAKVCYNVAC